MTTKAGAGHFGPLIPFAHAFRRAGADVLIAAPRGAASMVRSEGLPLWAFDDPPSAERDLIFEEVRDAPQPPAERVIGDIFARIDARAAYPGALTACQVWRPDVVISEITEFAGPLAAEAIGVPSIAVGISQQGKTNEVMPHAAAMVCHGGSGTVTMGLAAGIPMAVLPLFADQPWNAERVAALGAGIALEGARDAAPAIGDAVRRLLAEPSYREAAQGVAAEMRALPPVDAAIHVVRDLIVAMERRAA